MAGRANVGTWGFAREKLTAMTFETCRVLWKIGNICKCGIALPNVLPVFGRHFMTGIARKLLGNGVRGVRKLCVIDLRRRRDFYFLRSSLLGTPLGPRADLCGRSRRCERYHPCEQKCRQFSHGS